ncbi:hypothetical protein SLEP1_g231 [Rubroshorea leprosula]|uniref:Uncharacterized protein n=1 Tax=Rubroshorea leprosula TaxID=152421 RepID=A0AAV5HGV8_9ROSI|nr:hypothetical protein SLEP1_g231 [Rubroshorea leprosula]
MPSPSGERAVKALWSPSDSLRVPIRSRGPRNSCRSFLTFFSLRLMPWELDRCSRGVDWCLEDRLSPFSVGWAQA